MPNFDQFERLIRRAMVARDDQVREFSDQFEALASVNRPRLFKERRGGEFADWLIRARHSLRTAYGEGAQFYTTDQNAIGADLQVRGSDVQIELKSGAVTDANLGVGTIAWAVGDKAQNKELRNVMGGREMIKRREFAVQGKFFEISASQEVAMRKLEAYFRSRVCEGMEPPVTLAHLVRCVARGITKQKDMKELLNKNESNWNAPDIFHANWKTGWEQITHPFKLNESIIVSSINRTSHSAESDTIGRVRVTLEGVTSMQKALIYPNYKNSYKNTGNDRIPAKYWVATPCFHVWITQP